MSISTQTNLQITDNGRRFCLCKCVLTEFYNIFRIVSEYFKIWTNSGSGAEDVLNSVNIPRCDKLEFIDQYPMVSLSLNNNGNAEWPGPYYSIQDEFAKLPKLGA